ncbi:hypothetical protein IVB18_37210 [Bradyrhizobium sp. 186]|uniref:hypothetical protein n=1 Tax=Bradyrhizobium sp. 186 TaxID=2782654 RepID=UPI0020007F88|nr:hypothetical protein [Bradyrhizobium sp. 186]UPK33780.1 hypothetical protein IVB18_37210 [Bradyrhizobium sp. 186]
MSTLEAALRGGAVVLLLLRIVRLAQNARSDQLSRYSALMLMGIAAYIVESAPGFGARGLGWRIPIHVVNSGAAAAAARNERATIVGHGGYDSAGAGDVVVCHGGLR